MTNTVIVGIIGGPEIIIILVIVLLLFGGKQLPGLMRGVGKGIRDFKKAANTDEITKEFRDIASDLRDPLNITKPPQKKDKETKDDGEKK